MFPWLWLRSLVICGFLGLVNNSVSFRIARTTRSISHLHGDGPFHVSSTTDTALQNDTSTRYITVQPPVKALWDVLSGGILPQYYPSSVGGKPRVVPVLLSCSGGQDSMALLHAMGFIKHHTSAFVNFSPWNRLLGVDKHVDHESIYRLLLLLFANVHVVYFDHRARSDTDKDIDVIRSTCDQYGLNFHLEVADADIARLAHDYGSGNFQKCARDWRRDTYRRLINELPMTKAISKPVPTYTEGLSKSRLFNRRALVQNSEKNTECVYINEKTRGIVLLGHHLNDNVETFLFKLLRGVHLSNMKGMEPMSYLDDDNDIVILRPFVRFTKDSLGSFLESMNGTYHEDSSNSSPKYTRNRIRKSVLPELLKATSLDNRADVALESMDKRFRNLGAQSSALKESLDFETYMFSSYIASKYGLSNFVNPPEEMCFNGNHRGLSLSQLTDIYSGFYNSMSTATKCNNMHEKTLKYIKTLQFMRSIGITTKDVLLINEWLLVQSDLLRKDILYKFCLRACGQDNVIDYDVIDRISTFWVNEPATDALKMHVLPGEKVIAHQGTIAKICRPSTYDKASKEDATIYDDGHCSFRVFDNFKMHITPIADAEMRGSFYLTLSVPLSTLGGKPAAFDIRQLSNDDIVPCDSLWNRTATSILSKMNFPQILRDELPVIAFRDSNHVVGFYGLNIMAPYYVQRPQHITVSFGKDSTASVECKQYFIRLVNK
ncbi:tRNA lysidine synthetase, putative [Babesia ovis]|uniref:tRNA(Ile)-lysidine synthetase n=1 Tax=Babesia ovis TaxID=5869 RepID=A0A9W5TAT6_BABOV|nr:tRNA lysidine synthetase, putative [Babesia ovis]